MMLNLFTIFDPQTKIFSLNWMSSLLGLMLIPQLFWMKMSRNFYLLNYFMNLLMIEFKLLMKNYFNFSNLLFLMSLFLYILFNNFMGLFSYIFTSSSHLVFSMIFSLSLWMSLMLFGWLKNTFHMFVHLVPVGTPFVLMFFMVLIESLSNIIRPLTLSVRLTANMIAGHLLLTLLSSFIPELFFIYLIFLLLQIMLMMLEMAVSFIQSYVFIVLMILYLKETN